MSKMLDAADRLLAVDPGNLRALATAVYLEETQAHARPIQPMLSLFSIKPLPRPKPASAQQSRPA